jgi:nicotinamide-nucleotide amidase
MDKASLVTIGNELLIGHTVNTNAAYLGEKLLSIGVSLVDEHTVGDSIDSIVQALKLAADQADLILVTGGLGPTEDDLTRQALTKFLNVDLHLDQKLLMEIEKCFKKRSTAMPANNKLQAHIPAGASALQNKIGTAPGIRAEWKGKLIFVMPGVPYEMKQMFEESVLPEIESAAAKAAKNSRQVKVIHKLNCFGESESNIAEMLADLAQRDRNPQINYTVNYGTVTIHITATEKNIQQAKIIADADEKIIRKRLGSLVFSTGRQTLPQLVGQLLAAQNKTLAIAESCTGGLLAASITDIEGASRYFTHGWITYSNHAKISELGVPAQLLEQYGAVSEQIASAMAKGAKIKAATDYAIAITGIAGPTGGSEQKPVGLVFISITGADTETKKFIFTGNRQSIRIRAAHTALNMLRLQLQID